MVSAQEATAGSQGDDAIIAGQAAQGMGGGVAPDAESDEVDDMTNEEFMEAFSETFGGKMR